MRELSTVDLIGLQRVQSIIFSEDNEQSLNQLFTLRESYRPIYRLSFYPMRKLSIARVTF